MESKVLRDQVTGPSCREGDDNYIDFGVTQLFLASLDSSQEKKMIVPGQVTAQLKFQGRKCCRSGLGSNYKA